MFIFVSVMGTSPNREQVFRFKQFAVRNSVSAMKVGTDGVLLGSWCSVDGAHRALDVGTGTGLIALMLAQRSSEAKIDAIDIMRDAVDEARYNVGQSPWNDRIHVRLLDFLTLACDFEGIPYDLVVSNPPFFSADVRSPEYARRMARHGEGLDFRALIRACSGGLLARGGRLCMILPSALDQEVTFEAELAKMTVAKMTSVFTKEGAVAPSRTLWELQFIGDSKSLVKNDLVIGREEYRQLTSSFYL